VNLASPLSNTSDPRERPDVGCKLALQLPGKLGNLGIHYYGQPLPKVRWRDPASPQAWLEVTGEDLLKVGCGAPRLMGKPLPPFLPENIRKKYAPHIQQEKTI
jgi:hypothetical protein